MRHYKQKNCRKCGEIFLPTGNKHYYCGACRKEIKAEISIKASTKQRNKLKDEGVYEERRREYDRLYGPRRKKDRVKYGAREKVKHALKLGKLIKGLCEKCGLEKVEAHHSQHHTQIKRGMVD